MVDTLADRQFMARALFHAERGRGRTTPNPIVGAVIVSPDGVVVGQGAHMRAGGPHAEVVALDAAGSLARDATLYCTLEPCVHTGRTGPCVERIVAAGVRRVVIPVPDPNPRVSGRGTAFLRAHGIDVEEGVAREEALRQHRPFFTWVREQRPFVTLKIATSADGIVGRVGERVRITSAPADRFFHRQRAEVDAIAVGASTVQADDPLLTARGAYRMRPLTRVVFDWRARLSPSAALFSTLWAGPVIMVVLAEALASNPTYLSGISREGLAIEAFPDRRLSPVLRRLAAQDMLSLLVEGGPTLHEAFLEGELADRVQWVRSPDSLGHGIRVGARLGALIASGSFSGPRLIGRDVLQECDVHRIGRTDGTD